MECRNARHAAVECCGTRPVAGRRLQVEHGAAGEPGPCAARNPGPAAARRGGPRLREVRQAGGRGQLAARARQRQQRAAGRVRGRLARHQRVQQPQRHLCGLKRAQRACARRRPCVRRQRRGRPGRSGLRRASSAPGARMTTMPAWQTGACGPRTRGCGGVAPPLTRLRKPGAAGQVGQRAGRSRARAPAPVATSQRSSRSASSGCGSAMPAAQKRVGMSICARAAPGNRVTPPGRAGSRRVLWARRRTASQVRASALAHGLNLDGIYTGACQTCATSRSGHTRAAGAAKPAFGARPARRAP